MLLWVVVCAFGVADLAAASGERRLRKRETSAQRCDMRNAAKLKQHRLKRAPPAASRNLAGGVPADDCTSCIPLFDGLPYMGSTFGATGVDTTSCTVGDTASVWHCWTAACTGQATISLCDGTNYDASLAVFAECGGQELACNDDACDLAPEVTLPVQSGDTYQIRVAGFNGATGDYGVTVMCDPIEPACVGGDGDCCIGNESAGCSDSYCCQEVCTVAPECCAAGWNAACVGIAEALCSICGGGPQECQTATGSCCLSHPGSGCDDPACCQVVCAEDPFCCLTNWDGLCADQAIAQCSACDFPSPANDDCTAAESLEDGVTQFSSVGASTDGPDEPDCIGLAETVENDLWYEYEASCSGSLSVQTCGSGFDTVLAVYEGCGCPASPSLACDDDSCTGTLHSAVNIDGVEAGSCYTIRVGSFNPLVTGFGTIEADCVADYESCSSASGDCCGAHEDAGCADGGCCAAVCEVDSACCLVEWTKSCADIAADVCGVCGGGDGEDCAGCLTVTDDERFPGSTEGVIPGPPSSCAAGSDTMARWHCWDATCDGQATISLCEDTEFDSTLAVYANDCDGSELACNDDACGAFGPSEIIVPVLAGNQYVVRVAGYGGVTGDYSLDIDCAPDNPACVPGDGDCCSAHDDPGCEQATCCAAVCQENPACCETSWGAACVDAAAAMCSVCDGGDGDECVGCIPLVTDQPTPGSTMTAGGVDESSCALGDTVDAWHCWTASCTGGATFSLCDDTAFDATLAVFSGCAGSELGCDDDACGLAGPSEVTVPVAAGQPVVARVSGYGGASGDYSIEVTCTGIDNDVCSSATPITTGSQPFDTAGATVAGPDLPASCDEGFGVTMGADLWYDFIPSACGEVTVSTCGQATFDTRLAVYQGCACDDGLPGTLIACNDDEVGCAGLTSELQFQAQAASCYKIRVGGFGSAQGAGTLTLDQVETACLDCPSGEVLWIDPPSGTVDARRPHPPGMPEQSGGIDRLVVEAPPGAGPSCWSVCEGPGALEPNSVVSVEYNGSIGATLYLNRPMTAGAVTRVTFLGMESQTADFIAHAGNVNADTVTSPLDVLALIDALNGVVEPAWGSYSTDIDHSGISAPLDILALIDLLNGAGGDSAWNGTPMPPQPDCP
jgi:hypothetical protein